MIIIIVIIIIIIIIVSGVIVSLTLANQLSQTRLIHIFEKNPNCVYLIFSKIGKMKNDSLVAISLL